MHFLGLGLGKAFKVLIGISNLNYVTGCLHENNAEKTYLTLFPFFGGMMVLLASLR